jgi:hypothetical protein
MTEVGSWFLGLDLRCKKFSWCFVSALRPGGARDTSSTLFFPVWHLPPPPCGATCHGAKGFEPQKSCFAFADLLANMLLQRQ